MERVLYCLAVLGGHGDNTGCRMVAGSWRGRTAVERQLNYNRNHRLIEHLVLA